MLENCCYDFFELLTLNMAQQGFFGEIVQHYYNPGSEPYLIGETVLRGSLAERARALRDMRHPDKGLSVQPGKMSEIPEQFKFGCVAARVGRISRLTCSGRAWFTSRRS